MMQGPPGAPPNHSAPHSNLSVGAFVLALIGFFLGLIPFVGFLGSVGLVLASMDLRSTDPPGQPRKHGLSIAAVVFGTLATLGAIAWVGIFVWFEEKFSRGSCPHVYSYDGRNYQLDGDMASGALFQGAEREDVSRLEALRAHNGVFRLRLQNDLQEIDHVDRLQLLTVDAPADTTVVPSANGAVLAVRDRQQAIEQTHTTVRSNDGTSRERWTLSFPRSNRTRAALVLRARTTPFAEEALVRYLATMGQGVGPLLSWIGRNNPSLYQSYLSDEMDKLGLPLQVRVGNANERVLPIGPALLRTFALPVELSERGDRVTVTLEATHRFWDVSQIELATIDSTPTVQTLQATSAHTPSGQDVRAVLSEVDAQRVALRTGEMVDLEFTAPPETAGMTRTVLVQLRGYYDLPIGGPAGMDLRRVLAYRMGWSSLPQFAAQMR